MKINDLAPAVQTLDSAIHEVSVNQSVESKTLLTCQSS